MTPPPDAQTTALAFVSPVPDARATTDKDSWRLFRAQLYAAPRNQLGIGTYQAEAKAPRFPTPWNSLVDCRIEVSGQMAILPNFSTSGSLIDSRLLSRYTTQIVLSSAVQPLYDIVVSHSPGVTAILPNQPRLALRPVIERLFQAGRSESFEDGMDSEFIHQLQALIVAQGPGAVDAIAYLLDGDAADPVVASEALRWLGRINHPPTYARRVWLLERSLASSSRWIRYGAALGLASMRNRRAIRLLADAIDHETVKDLRRDLRKILSALEATS